jgi:hypothetical protein
MKHFFILSQPLHMASTPSTSSAVQPGTAQAGKQATTKPVFTFKYGTLSAAIFADKVKMPSGKTVAIGHVSLRRSYRNADGEWEHTHSLRQRDLLTAAQLLEHCWFYLVDPADDVAEDENQEE